MDPKEAGDARSRLAAVMRGEKVGIDNLALTQIVDMKIKETPKVFFAGSENSNLCYVYEDHYHISVRLTEEVAKYDIMDSLDVEYTVQVNVLKTNNNEADTNAILSLLQSAIIEKRKKNRVALTPYVANLPE